MSTASVAGRATVLDLAPNDVVASSSNETGVDLQPYEGSMICVLDAEAGGSGITYAVKIQDSADNSSFTDLSGAAFTTTTANTALVEKLVVDIDDCRRYVRAVITVAGGDGAGAVSVKGIAFPKYG
jgi:hypothetical protein|tara:strand:+ start:904 stop:1281 length:378 start_codon:yes stop_codon:yes gene_type:complete